MLRYTLKKLKKPQNVDIGQTTYLPLLTFVDIWTTTYLPLLVNVVCERPLKAVHHFLVKYIIIYPFNADFSFFPDSKRPKQNSTSEAMASDKDQKSKEKLGHRRIGQDGVISYKKVNSNHLMGSIQLGLGHAVGNLSKHDDRDLLMQVS